MNNAPVKSSQERRRVFRTNRNAATLAFLTLLLLVPGLFLPFVKSTIIGHETIYSVITGITQLYTDHHPFLAIIIFVFSVLFPITKASFLLLSTSSLVPITKQNRKRLAHFAITTGKYSLLDLLIVALLIIIVKLDGLAQVEPMIGTAFFGSSVLISMLAGLCVDFRDSNEK